MSQLGWNITLNARAKIDWST